MVLKVFCNFFWLLQQIRYVSLWIFGKILGIGNGYLFDFFYCFIKDVVSVVYQYINGFEYVLCDLEFFFEFSLWCCDVEVEYGSVCVFEVCQVGFGVMVCCDDMVVLGSELMNEQFFKVVRVVCDELGLF